MTIDKIVKKIAILHSTSTFTPTSFSLARQIVKQLKIDWSRKDLKFLDPVCGRGNLLLALAEKLEQSGHSRKYIVENMLYGFDVEKIQSLIATKALRCFYNGNINIYNEDFLAKDSNMQFDVVFGNPPYQDGNQGYWKLFAHKAYKHTKDNGIMIFITPNSWANASHLNTDKNIFNSIFQKNKILYINTNVNSYFPTVGKNIGYWILQKSKPQGLTVVTNGVDSSKVKLSDFPFFINVFSPLALSIFDKVLKKKEFWSGFVEGPSRSNKEFAFPKAKHIKYDSFGYKYDAVYNNYPTSKAVLALDCSAFTLDQVKNIYSHFNTKIYKFLWKIYGAEGDASSFGWVLRNMPKLNIDLVYTDEEIYEYFKFTKDECAFIEQSIN